MKYHRPRGLFCCTGSCASCLVGVDGEPNVAACTRRPDDGATVISQNRIGSAQRDLLGAIDKLFPDHFDPHGAFTFPRPVNALFLHGVRAMSGWGRAPPPGSTLRAAHRAPQRHTTAFDHVVIGGGRHGLLAARATADQGRRTLLIEEASSLGGSMLRDPGERETAALVAAMEGCTAEVWTDALAFGIYEDVVAVRRGQDLWEVTADDITIAPGRHDAWPMFPGNDLPGILSLRGARRLWYQHGVLPGRRIAVHGAFLPRPFAAALQAAGARIVCEGTVTAVTGGPSVERAEMDGSWHAVDTVISHLPGVARVELFQQAGCKIGWDGGPAPVVAPDGTTSVPRVRGRFSSSPEAA